MSASAQLSSAASSPVRRFPMLTRKNNRSSSAPASMGSMDSGGRFASAQPDVPPQCQDELGSTTSSGGGSVLGLVRGEVESRLAQVRGLIPDGGREPSGQADCLVDPRGLAVDISIGMGLDHSSPRSRATSTLHEPRPVAALSEEAAEYEPMEEYYRFLGRGSKPIHLKLIAIGCSRLDSQWPRCRLSRMQVQVHEVGILETPTSRWSWQPWQETSRSEIHDHDDDGCSDRIMLTELQQSILNEFFCSSLPTSSARSRNEVWEVLDAAAEVLVELCTQVVCHLNGLYPRLEAETKGQPRVPRMVTTKLPEQSSSSQRFRRFQKSRQTKVRDASGGSRLQRQASGSEHADLPTTLDPTPWDGPTSAQDSLQLWQAVKGQSLPEVREELGKIQRKSQSIGEQCWTSRVLEHRHRFRHPSNPKPLTGTVFLFALHELEQAVMKAGAFEICKELEVAVDICKELQRNGADPEATYKVEECGKYQAIVTAPLCFAARSAHTLQVLLGFNVTLGRRSRINYYRHGTILWQAAWMNNGDMIRFLMDNERQDNRSTGGRYLYQLTHLKGHELEPDRVLQWEKAKDAIHKIATAEESTTYGKAVSVIQALRAFRWPIWYRCCHLPVCM